MSPLVRVLFLLGVLAWPGALAAQEFSNQLPNQFPNHPIRFVVPFPAGGPSDFISRVLTEKMATLLGGTIVIENRPGAGGMTGIASVAKASPDGYTIAIAPSSQLAMNINLRESMPFHPIKDLALLTLIVSVPEILVVNETVPAKTLADFVTLAKAQPGKIVFASTGVGGMPHLAMELLMLTADIRLVHVPYTGAAPAVNDLLGNRVQTMFADVPILLGHIQAGKLRALAIGSHSRIASLPDLATTGELGMPQVLADNWYGLVAPADTPAPILAKLQSAATQALNSPDVRERLASQGAIAVGNSSAEFQAYVKSEIERWGRVIAATGIKIK